MAKFSRASLCLALVAAMLWCTMAETNSLDIEIDSRQLLTTPVVKPPKVKPVVVVVKPKVETGANTNAQVSGKDGVNQDAQNSGITGGNNEQYNSNYGRKLLDSRQLLTTPVVKPPKVKPVVVVVKPKVETGANTNAQTSGKDGVNQNAQNSGITGGNNEQYNTNGDSGRKLLDSRQLLTTPVVKPPKVKPVVVVVKPKVETGANTNAQTSGKDGVNQNAQNSGITGGNNEQYNTNGQVEIAP